MPGKARRGLDPETDYEIVDGVLKCRHCEKLFPHNRFYNLKGKPYSSYPFWSRRFGWNSQLLTLTLALSLSSSSFSPYIAFSPLREADFQYATLF